MSVVPRLAHFRTNRAQPQYFAVFICSIESGPSFRAEKLAGFSDMLPLSLSPKPNLAPIRNLGGSYTIF